MPTDEASVRAVDDPSSDAARVQVDDVASPPHPDAEPPPLTVRPVAPVSFTTAHLAGTGELPAVDAGEVAVRTGTSPASATSNGGGATDGAVRPGPLAGTSANSTPALTEEPVPVHEATPAQGVGPAPSTQGAAPRTEDGDGEGDGASDPSRATSPNSGHATARGRRDDQDTAGSRGNGNVPAAVTGAAAPGRLPADQPPTAPAPDRVLAAVERMRTHVATLPLGLEVTGVDAARSERESLLRQLDDYLLPRLRRRDAPLLAVIGGSTGAGKSTLTNSLVQREVSRSGVLRPTTRSPVLVHHPADSGAFLSQRILPHLTRVTSEAPEPVQPIDPHAPRITGLRLVPHDGLSPGLALVDAPDIDSLVDTNRDLAVQLLAAADLWIFVTTATRYADAMPWRLLLQAVERGVAVAVVLDRVPPASLQELRIDLAMRLRDRGLVSTPMFVIPETETVDGFLPVPIVAPLLAWLHRVAGDERSRALIATRTLGGAVSSLPSRVRTLATAADAQAAAVDELIAVVHEAFATATTNLTRRLADGTLVRGEVQARWQDFMADGALLRRLDSYQPTLGERLFAALRRQPPAIAPLSDSVTPAVAAAISAALRTAASQTVSRWRQHPAGARLSDAENLAVAGGELDALLEQTVHGWREGVRTLARAAIEQARAEGYPAGPDTDTAAAVLLIAAVNEPPANHDGESTTPSEATAAAAQRILGAVIGEVPVANAAQAARDELATRAAALLDAERARLEKLLDAYGASPARGDALRAAAQVLQEAR